MAQENVVVCTVPDGILFIYDPAINAKPPIPPEDRVQSSSSYVALRAYHDSDGPITLVLTNNNQGRSSSAIFRGLLNTPGRKLAFHNSQGKALIQAAVSNTSTYVTIFTDDRNYPSKFVCLVDRPEDPEDIEVADLAVSWWLRIFRPEL